MENDELARLRAENIGLKLKIKDLEAILKRRQERFDTLHEAYQGIKLAFDRARSLLEEYAGCPGTDALAKLDRKLNLFFPEIMQAVKYNRVKNRGIAVKVVDGTVKYGSNNPDLDIRY